MTADTTTIHSDQNPAEAPAYSLADAAHLVRTPHSTVRAWCLGQGQRQADGKRQFNPVIELDDPEGRYASFRNLVELHVLVAIRRQYNISLQNTRRAVSFMRERLGGEHPLASQRMLTDGKDLLVREGGRLLNVSRAGQVEMDIVSAFLERIEFDAGGALLRLYPFTTTSIEEAPKIIVVDPRVQFGRPCLFGTGIPTDVLLDRFLAGEAIAGIAADYEVDPQLVEGAIRFERLSAA
jgi:uncharacterized protein (DUF433 family)